MKGSDATLKVVKRVLKFYQMKIIVKERNSIEEKDFRKVDLVIAIGGDGTFLRTSHFIEHIPHMGVNSNPKMKEGFFMRTTRQSFKTNFERLLAEQYKVLNLSRLEVKLNGKKIKELALNEVYIGNVRQYHTSRYVVDFGKKELQRSSGLILCTAAGSYAWARSAGGKVMPSNSKRMQMVVRESYKGKIYKSSFKSKVLDSKKIVKIESLMDNGIFVIDSLSKEYKFKTGSKIEIKPSKFPLKFILFE